ncbi:anti-phage ZorAB system protein ZorA [Desulfovibrionales bacterium]
MNAVHFDIYTLLPEFDQAFASSSSDSITASFVVFMFIIFGVGLMYALRRYFQARHQIGFYKKLLADLTLDDLGEKREEIRSQALQSKFGKLWREFDESLVASMDGKILSNTLDADHFFNEKSLACNLTGNRLLAATPALLTGIGVLGTFVGLQLGLASLDLTTDSDINILKGSIFSMMSGASTAFVTSVWGVGLSLIFNFAEKIFERGVRHEIIQLQNRIDFLYPRITPEQTLIKISDTSRTTSQTMQSLAEQIGDRLQQSLVQASDSIRQGMSQNLIAMQQSMDALSNNMREGLEKGMHEILKPAVESISHSAQNSGGEMVKTLVSQFMDGVHKAGSGQQEALEKAASTVQVAVEGMAVQMHSIMQAWESHGKATQEHSQQAINNINHALQNSQSAFEKRSASLHEEFTEQLNKLSTSLEDKLYIFTKVVHDISAMQEQKDTKRQEEFSNSLTEVRSSQEVMTAKFFDLTSELGSVSERMHLLAQAHETLGQSLLRVSQNMETASANLGSLGLNLSAASGHIESGATLLENGAKEVSGVIQDAVVMTKDLSHDLRTSLTSMDEIQKELARTAEYMVSASTTSKDGFATIKNDLHTFNQEFFAILDNYTTAIDNHLHSVEKRTINMFETINKEIQNNHDTVTANVYDRYRDFSNHVAGLLEEFGQITQTQISDRLNQWNAQTSEFTSTMTTAVTALSNVVDEIEGKVGRA